MKRKIDIKFGDKEYTVSADFATVERIEGKFDMMGFLRSIQTYRARTKDIAWVLYCAVNEAGYDDKYKDIGEAVLDDLELATTAAAEIVASAFGAGPEKKVKKNASAEKASTTDDGLE